MNPLVQPVISTIMSRLTFLLPMLSAGESRPPSTPRKPWTPKMPMTLKKVGELSTLAHGVKGTVYTVGDIRITLKDFYYDGKAPDAFFYAGRSGQPSGSGYPREQWFST